MSLSHSLAAADAIQFHIDEQLKRTDNRAHTDHEKEYSRSQKAKAMRALDSTLSIIKNAVQDARRGCGDEYNREPEPERREPKKVLQNGLGNVKALGEDQDSDVDKLIQTMSADKVNGLGSINPSLQDMANSCEPIMTNFDSVLSKPYLSSYSATINSVPVVGLRDQSIMYVQTQVDPSITGTTKDVWSLFSTVPAGVVVDESKKVHFFPYQGDFCFSFGKSVWKKAHRMINPIMPTESDPEIAQAMDNWPKLYKDDWETVGDSALPDDNLLDVIPFSILAADSTRIGFRLMTLKTDNSINVLNGDTLTDNNKWDILKYAKVKNDPESPDSAPKWTRMSYWNNIIVALDDASNTWDIAPNFQGGTYTATNKIPIDPIIDLTASDVGAIGVQADGFMYKRIVVPPKDDNDQPTLKWTRWIKTDGVKDLGVASPGVILDLQLLTRTLKSRYIETQTALYPAINTINGFAVTHAYFLQQMQDAAKDWADADGDQAKQEIALKNGKSFVTHASVWAGILDTSTKNVKTSVNIMAAQLIDVNRQLLIQLGMLQNKLERLKATLSSQEDALSKLQGAFWGMVAAALLSIAVAIVGVLTANPLVFALAGTLFVGGVIGMVVLSIKISELEGQIQDTKSQISTVTEAISELTTVTTNFGDLAEFYATMNMFWGRMVNNAGNLKQMDNATAIEIGIKTLEDTSSIDAALGVTNDMAAACTTYLDVLNKQGIVIPDDLTDGSDDEVELLEAPRLMNSRPTKNYKSSNKRARANLRSKATAHHKNFHKTVLQARNELAAGNDEAYALTMTKAFVLHQSAAAAMNQSTTAGGLWFDTAALNATGSFWYQANQSTPFGMSNDIAALDSNSLVQAKEASNDLVQAKENVTSLVNGVISLADIMMTWEQEYPEIPKPSQKEEVLRLQDKSCKLCNEAIRDAAMANNAFVSFNHKATDYTLSLNAQIGQKNNDESGAVAAANSRKDNIDVPWYVYAGGVATVLLYKKVKQDEIDAELRNQLDSLNEDIRKLKEMQDSGVTIDGQAKTWMEMAQSVSEHLGSIYNILSGAVNGQLLEDPTMYADLIKMEWNELRKNAEDVLAILQAQSKPIVFMASIAEPVRTGHALKSGQALKASSTDSKELLKAFLPNAKLGSNIQGQADSALMAFSDMEALLRLPYGSDIIVKWEDDASTRVTLLEVSANLRREYVSLVAGQYDTISQLQYLSVLQKVRSDNAASGKLKLATFVANTLATLRTAQSAAKKSADKFASTADKFAVLMKQIDDNIDALQSKIKGLDDDIASVDKQVRDKIIWVIADSIALAFSIGAMLATFGFLGPVAAAVSLAAKIGATAALTASSVKLVLDSLSLADLVNTVAALKQTRRDILISVNQLNAVQPLFRNVVEGVAIMSGSLDDMVAVLEKVQLDVELIGEGSLSREDAEEIGEAWEGVGVDCTSWLDVVNAQGIDPSL